MINRNPQGDYPQIDNSAFIHPTAVIIGKVKIGKKVFVGPGAVIRADEPKSSIFIGDNCNVQDRVVVHALQNSSVYVDDNTSLSHSCIVHGPCKIAKNCFIGFGSVIFNAELGQGVVIKHLAVVEKVVLLPGKAVEPLQLINNETKAKKLKKTDKITEDFVNKVLAVNKKLLQGYSR
ncbi:MAG: DapH/DapD/GlmU-related protein [Elusimicrobiota bacterium]